MRLVRLSVFSATGARPHILVSDDAPAKPRFTIHPVVHTATLLCLFGSIFITLLTLLLPNENFHLSVFSIEPLGDRMRPLPLVVNASSSGMSSGPSSVFTSGTSHVSWTGSSSGFARPVPTTVQLRSRVLSNVTAEGQWTGHDQPTIYVGVMQLCSKVNNSAVVNCTSISEAGTYDHLLPSSLAPTITTLPKSPLTPILLLAGGIATLLAVIIHLVGLALQVSLTKNVASFFHLKLWSAAPPLPPKDGDSIIGLVAPQTNKSSIPGSYFASLGLTAVGMGLSIGAAVLEMQAVRAADKAWDDAEGEAVGLRFAIDTGTYLIALIPAALLLAIIVSTIPIIRAKSVQTPPTPDKDDPEEKVTTQPEISEFTARKIEQHGEAQKESVVSDADTVQVRSALPRPPRSSLRRSQGWSLFHAV